MSQKFTFENLIKKELSEEKIPFDESLWNKLDQKLIPVREAYQKKNKRRAVAYWSVLGILLIGGSVAVFNKTDNTSSSNQQAVTKANDALTTKESEKNVKQDPLTVNAPTINTDNNVLVATPQRATKSIAKNEASSLNKNVRKIERQADESFAQINTTQKRVHTKKEKVVFVDDKKESAVNNNEVIVKQDDVTVIEKPIAAVKDKEVVEGKKEEKTTVTEEGITTKTPLPTTTNTAKVKNKATTQPLEIYAGGGLNFSNPFDKAGYYGAIHIEKQIEDKRIFAGVKVAYNNLNHQLIASNKVNTFPLVTDAVINKMTTIQIPFGYQFKLSKKPAQKAWLLNVGFEPTLITGIQTIYYDDNGVPGGPRTPVVNSPLLKNAINKFNVSFIAGIKKQITNRIGVNFNAGYGMIDMTDKQYYNRTNNNNNLKYMQVGLLFRLK